MLTHDRRLSTQSSGDGRLTRLERVHHVHLDPRNEGAGKEEDREEKRKHGGIGGLVDEKVDVEMVDRWRDQRSERKKQKGWKEG